MEKDKIKEVAGIIKKGGIVIFPTDTVYGIGASAFNQNAVKRIYKIKGRQKKKPLILFIRHKKEISRFIKKIPKNSYNLIKKYWPGSLTLIFNAKKNVPSWLKDKRSTIGVRIPDNPIALAIVESAGPLATTSANISGKKSPVKIKDIPVRLLKKVDLVIDGGPAKIGRESTVLDLTEEPFKVLRKGAIKIK